MMVQYTAAALVSDNKTLAHPDSVDSIPSCANQEDHVSMGANAARHTLEILDNVRHVLAIELLTAAQAVDLREHGRTVWGWAVRRPTPQSAVWLHFSSTIARLHRISRRWPS